MQVVWGHCHDHVGSGCGSAFFALACELPMEYLAALRQRSHEAHAADNAFVAGMEGPRVPPQHAGVGGMDMQRKAGMLWGRRHSIDWPCHAPPCSMCLDTTDGRPARTDLPLDGDLSQRDRAEDMRLRIQVRHGFERLAIESLLADRRMVSWRQWALDTFRDLCSPWAMMVSWTSVAFGSLTTRVRVRRSSAAVSPRLHPWQRVG